MAGVTQCLANPLLVPAVTGMLGDNPASLKATGPTRLSGHLPPSPSLVGGTFSPPSWDSQAPGDTASIPCLLTERLSQTGHLGNPSAAGNP